MKERNMKSLPFCNRTIQGDVQAREEEEEVEEEIFLCLDAFQE